MNKKLENLFEKLNIYWGKVDRAELEGEHISCGILQQEILNEIYRMDSVDVVKLINELTDNQINQIIAIIEEIISYHPQVIHSLRIINRERNIYWLNDELKLLGLLISGREHCNYQQHCFYKIK